MRQQKPFRVAVPTPAPAETVWHALTYERELHRWFGREDAGLTSVLSTHGIDSPAAGKLSATTTSQGIAYLLFNQMAAEWNAR